MNVSEILLLTIVALLMRVGLAMQVSGLSRSKNAGGATLRVLFDMVVATLVFWAFGASVLLVAPGSAQWIDTSRLLGIGQPMDGRSLFYLTMILLASGIAVGAVVERSRFFVGIVAPLLLAGLIVPVLGRWTWNGWLTDRGVLDVGGAGAVHVAGAVVALVIAKLVGPRGNKFNRDGSSNMIPGHNLPMATIGYFVMLVAWVPYLLGAALLHGGNVAPVAMNVLLSGSAGALSGLLVGKIRYGKPELMLTFAGLLTGLVAVSAGAGNIPSWGAVLTGAVAGLIVPTIITWLDLRLRIDDPAGLIAIHLTGGAWGLVAAALFHSTPLALKFKALGAAGLTLGAVVVFTLVVSGVVFGLLHKTVGLRSKEVDEFDGLDLAEHDLNAFPDFQQTTIKSYHLREA